MKKWVPPLIHLLTWSFLLYSNVRDFLDAHSEYVEKAIQASGIRKDWYAFFFNLAHMTVFLVAFYGAYFFVGPLLFIRKKYFRAVICLLLVLAAMVLTRWLIEFKLLLPFLRFDNYFGNPFQPWYYIRNCINFTYRYLLFGLLVYFLTASYKIEREKKEIEKEKIQAELSFLRSQINPHFLFNTINDIYALTYTRDPRAPDALLRLSAILRYMISEGVNEQVLLEKELAYLNDYIKLQAIGLKNNLYFEYSIRGEVQHQLIAPLLLIPFVENIFKHAEIDDPAHPARLSLEITGERLLLQSSNRSKAKQKDATGGIGLSNVRRRLELLYPGKHKFTLSDNAGHFSCSLQLELKNRPTDDPLHRN
jgi:two-component system LytT family sensor kinase